jgi:hypothetical protein
MHELDHSGETLIEAIASPDEVFWGGAALSLPAEALPE